jgi:UDPglucose 6-dehydrogenase
MSNISIFGLGKLGLPLAASWAEAGHHVIGVDLNSELIKNLRKENGLWHHEPGLEELLQKNKEKITFTTDATFAVENTEISFIVVATPSDEKGGFSLQYVLSAVKSIGLTLKEKTGYHLVVLTSTVLPGSTNGAVKETLEKYSEKKCGEAFGLCYNPEFIALGNVLHDLRFPDFVLIGESDAYAGSRLEELYQTFLKKKAPIKRMNFVNAEITKLALNTFITTKITFANLLARICERIPGADVDVVCSALGEDARIGSKYLKGAVAYGGPCFPRDNHAFSFFAQQVGFNPILPLQVDEINRRQTDFLVSLISNKRKSEKFVVGILGVSYKPDTDVVEESQGLLLAQALVKSGVPVCLWDPVALLNAKKVLGLHANYAESLQNCIKESEILVITTPWPEFSKLSAKDFPADGKSRVVLDCWRILDNKNLIDVVEIIPLGKGGLFSPNEKLRR